MSIELSVILPTDSYETIAPVLEHLRRQTIADRIEIVLVVPAAADIPDKTTCAALQIQRMKSITPLGEARAIGVRAASAPFVFVGETHSYLRADAAEKLLSAAHSTGATVVVPGFENANPGNILSWAAFLVDYGRWTPTSTAREIKDMPLYNALFRRDDLLQLGERLERAFAHGDEMSLALRSRNARVYFEPAAHILHLNISAPAHTVHEQFLAGAMIGRQRVKRWGWPKRLLYAAASPLIPFVLFRRNVAGAWRTIRARELSWSIIAAMLVLDLAKATGECVAYLGLNKSKYEAIMDRYEIRKRDYAIGRS